MSTTPATQEAIESAKTQLDAHVRDMVKWHFSPETGTPYWLEYAAKADWNPLEEVKCFEDIRKFDHFEDENLRFLPHEVWVPKAFEGRPFNVFETGGTTGMPKQRIGWDDYKYDYEQFSDTLTDESFPKGGNWLMLGPTGPRRLRLAVEHLANHRGGSCYFLDMDPRWVKQLITRKEFDEANRYKDHAVAQAATILKHRNVSCLFATPKLLEALGERISIPGAGIKGVFCGGTSMNPQYLRFLSEEVLEGKAQLVPTYGNTLMGLAACKPLSAEDNYSLTYYAPQPRAALRVVSPDDPNTTVGYNEWGRVELTTLTKEFFMPRFLERDEALRIEPYDR